MVRVPPASRRLAALAVAAAAALALAGCVDAAEEEPRPTASATPSPTATPEPTTEPTESAEPLEPIAVGCGALVDPDVVYAFDPNYALIGAFDPDPGTAAAEALDHGGIACRWVRETGSATIDLSVARRSEADLERLKNEAFASSEMVPTYGEEAYFDPATGTAIVFEGPFWLVITSPSFAEPGEPTGIIDAALATVAAS